MTPVPSRTTQLARAFALIAAALLLHACQRPYLLTRTTAAAAVESTAQFQHKTKLFFAVDEAEAAIPGACHNFDFSPEKMKIVNHYLETGTLKFSPLNPRFPAPIASLGSLDLSLGDQGLLVDHIDTCKAPMASKTTGYYELSLGKPIVEVNGIREDGNRASVDFTWHFESLDGVGQAFTEGTKKMETSNDRLTADAKSSAPFWTGSAELAKYDDGWRVLAINLELRPNFWDSWHYGPPSWPDPSFNWGTFDEDENHD